MRSKGAMRGMINVIKQIYFPREIIIVLLSGEVLVDFGFMFIAMLIVNAFFGIYPNIYYPLLIFPIVLMVLLSIGIGFILSWLTMIVRDLEQLTGVVINMLMYLTVLLDVNSVSERMKMFILLNPVSAITEAFRAIVIYDQPPDFVSLFVPLALTSALLYTGYIFFKVNEDRLVDFE
jgi:ABC-type polysaccharide/polyol phosphate export permease